MSKHEKGSIGDHSSKTMLKEIDDQLETLAGLIVSFLHTVDEEDELYYLVEKLCDYDDVIMDTFLITDNMNESSVICRQLITECIDLSIKRIHQKQMNELEWAAFP